MIKRIAQRTADDCAICTVAMVMGEPYSYARVLKDSAKYPPETNDGKFWDWWNRYLVDEGYKTVYRPFLDLYKLPDFGGGVLGILVLLNDRFRKGHVVAVDEIGIIDPADNSPDHVAIQDYLLRRLGDGFRFDEVFLAVQKSQVPKSK
jgi:hypothetical protein